MNTPTVLDSEGKVLEVGSQVTHEHRGEGVVGIVSQPAPVPRLCIRRDHAHSFWVKTVPAERPSTYRCPDLTLVTTEETT